MINMARILPAELTDRVIDHLHSDKNALATCSLVCKTWLPASRYHFFQAIDIRLTDNNVYSFAELMDSPASTLFAHRLEVEIFPISNDNDDPYSASSILGAISHHLSRLKIRSLSFTCVEWDIDENLEAIFGCFATISILYLEDVLFLVPDQFIQFITSFLSLKELYLGGTTLKTQDIAHIIPFTLSPPLHTVDLILHDWKLHSTTWFLSAVQFPPLRSLHISWIEDEDLDVVQTVLKSLGPSIHHLDLQFMGSGTFISECCSDSSFNPVVQTISVIVST